MRSLGAAVAVAAALAAGAASASAASYTLRPDGAGSSSGFTISPAGATSWEALGEPVLQPAAPDTTDGYGSASTTGARLSVTLATQTLASGEVATGVTAWAYLSTGSKTSTTLWLADGWYALRWAVVPANTPPGWHSVTLSGSLSQKQIDDLVVSATTNGKNGGTAGRVYAAYAQLDTADPPADPAAPAPDIPPVTPSVLPAPMSIPAAPVRLSPKGVVPVALSCAIGLTDCSGVVTLEAVGKNAGSGSAKLALGAARRVKRVYGRHHYKIAAGQTGVVRVRMNRRNFHKVKRILRHRHFLKLAVVARQKDASGKVTTFRREVRILKPRKHRRH
jgi:hypothetical protein